MTISLEAKANGTQGAIKVNGTDAVVVDPTGIISGVNKSAVSQMPMLGTAVATTSGTAIDFTGIPAWVKRITVMFNTVSTNGASNWLIRIGAGGIESSGYTGGSSYWSGGASTINDTTGFPMYQQSAASTYSGSVTLTNVSGNTWVISGLLQGSAGTGCSCAGSKTLSGTLDRLRLTTVVGTDTFDAGSVNIFYE